MDKCFDFTTSFKLFLRAIWWKHCSKFFSNLSSVLLAWKSNVPLENHFFTLIELFWDRNIHANYFPYFHGQLHFWTRTINLLRASFCFWSWKLNFIGMWQFQYPSNFFWCPHFCIVQRFYSLGREALWSRAEHNVVIGPNVMFSYECVFFRTIEI